MHRGDEKTELKIGLDFAARSVTKQVFPKDTSLCTGSGNYKESACEELRKETGTQAKHRAHVSAVARQQGGPGPSGRRAGSEQRV